MNAKLLGLAVLLACLLAAGCNKTADTPATPQAADAKTDGEADDGEHGAGPHGGTVIELGGKYHGELVVDHAKKQATVYVLDIKVKNPAPVAVAKLTLSIKTPPFQADLVAVPQDGDPAGKASRFVATHESFGKEQEFEGTVSGVIDGKPRAGDFQEKEHKDHDHGKPK